MNSSWFQWKLDAITSEFLTGSGHGSIYEAQFLAYLDGLLVALGVPSCEMWNGYREACRRLTPKGTDPRCFSLNFPERRSLVDALQEFKNQRENLVEEWTPPPAVGAQEEPLGILDFLEG